MKEIDVADLDCIHLSYDEPNKEEFWVKIQNIVPWAKRVDGIKESGGSITIATDSDESNSNSEVWDWLVDQFIPVMKSEVAVIKSASISYKSGVDIGFSLISKTKGLVSEDEIVEVYSEQATN